MNRQLSQYNIEVSSTVGVSIDITSPLTTSIYKLKLQYLDKFPEQFLVKLTQENQDKEWQVLNAFVEFFETCGDIFFKCHDTLNKLCYTSFNLMSDDHRSIYLFVSRDATLPILVKGLASKISSVTLLDGTPVNYRQTSPHNIVAGVLWVLPAKAPLNKDLNIIKITLATPLKLFLGTGAPIIQN